jgi:hypothetical protein
MNQWKFLKQRDGEIVSAHGSQEWTPGEWNEVSGEIIACENGFHCSPGILAALIYVKGEILAEVEVAGESVTESDKSAHQKMRIVKAYYWTRKDSVQLAVLAAEKVLSIFEDARPGDDYPRKAIEAAKAWLADPSADAIVYDAIVYAAPNYATNAAHYAAYAAHYAANTAYYAAYTAYYAAYAAIAAAEAALAADSHDSVLAAQVKLDIETWLQAHVAELRSLA